MVDSSICAECLGLFGLWFCGVRRLLVRWLRAFGLRTRLVIAHCMTTSASLGLEFRTRFWMGLTPGFGSDVRELAIHRFAIHSMLRDTDLGSGCIIGTRIKRTPIRSGVYGDVERVSVCVLDGERLRSKRISSADTRYIPRRATKRSSRMIGRRQVLMDGTVIFLGLDNCRDKHGTPSVKRGT